MNNGKILQVQKFSIGQVKAFFFVENYARFFKKRRLTRFWWIMGKYCKFKKFTIGQPRVFFFENYARFFTGKYSKCFFKSLSTARVFFSKRLRCLARFWWMTENIASPKSTKYLSLCNAPKANAFLMDNIFVLHYPSFSVI